MLIKKIQRAVIECVLHFHFAGLQEATFVIERQFEIFAVAVNGHMSRIIEVDNAIRFNARDARRVEHALILPRAEWHRSLNHDL